MTDNHPLRLHLSPDELEQFDQVLATITEIVCRMGRKLIDRNIRIEQLEQELDKELCREDCYEVAFANAILHAGIDGGMSREKQEEGLTSFIKAAVEFDKARDEGNT